MIRYILALLMLMSSLLLVDPNPLWAAPLALLPVSFVTRKAWIGLVGVLGFDLFTLGRVEDLPITDYPRFALLVGALVLPSVLEIEALVAPRPYRLEGFSIGPVLLSSSIILAIAVSMFLIVRIQRIGIYIGSDPTLQMFMLTALSILFTAPFLLGTGGKRTVGPP